MGERSRLEARATPSERWGVRLRQSVHGLLQQLIRAHMGLGRLERAHRVPLEPDAAVEHRHVHAA